MVDMYKHLNKAKDFEIKLDMEQVANMVCDCNYGFHRFVSAVINRYKQSNSNVEQKWAEELEKLLESGLY